MSFTNWKETARQLKREVYALYFAVRDPRVPWYAKLLAGGIVAYALTPIDLIPDFIPVLGYLDDLIIVPLGVIIALKLIPPPVMAECRQKSAEVMAQGKPISRAAAVVIIAIWLLLAALGVMLILRVVGG